ncbi:spliceosomal complex protein [Malassezia pachydermatis]|uniref:Rna-binding domain-containing protein n=1 Tax=Malassezia pachydermatis TaxID=77020 RepID=A0A0M8MWJ8_9BASI|nr:rna-binding domain-containing protein [Malassezia pachydermatis]KOS15744.1 rna-binding domain-containing protein [Malassezia pachydermatis]
MLPTSRELGTEQDKVNCSFYFKIGACRHGDRCSRRHVPPTRSKTILLSNLYQNPKHLDPHCHLSNEELQQQFDQFFTDLFKGLSSYGELVEVHVCDNVGDHLIGNVYARYESEDDAQRAVDGLNTRWFHQRPIFAELSPVSDFREACCRQNETNECNRGGQCNFMHLRYASPALIRELYHELAVENREKRCEKMAKQDFMQLGWKERMAQVEAEAAATYSDMPKTYERDWRHGPSGGNWREGPEHTHDATA